VQMEPLHGDRNHVGEARIKQGVKLGIKLWIDSYPQPSSYYPQLVSLARRACLLRNLGKMEITHSFRNLNKSINN
jgi:hypothetical protein